MRLALPIALALVACAEPTRVRSGAPADVRWVALLELDAEGRVARLGPLARWEEGALPVYSQTSRGLLVLGYTEAQIAEVGAGASRSQIQAEALALAPACGPRLPLPVWSARVVGEGVEPAIGEPPALTASWLDASCASSGELWVDDRCLNISCAPELARSQCAVEATLPGCTVPSLGGTLGPKGGLCLDVEALGCTRLPPPEGAAAAVSCPTDAAQECEMIWYTARTELELRERRVALDVDRRAWRPVNFTAGPAVGPQIFPKGYAWDLAPTPLGALVSGPGREPQDECDSTREGVIHVIDAVLGQEVATATAPPCLRRLAASPEDGLVIGLYAERDEWRLGRFDARGQLLSSVPADPRPQGDARARRPTKSEWIASDLSASRDGWVVAWHEDEPRGASLVFTYDRALAPRGRVELEDRWITSATAMDDGTVATTVNEGGELSFVDPAQGTTVRRVELSTRESTVRLPASAMYSSIRAAGELFVASCIPPAMHAVGRGSAPVELAIPVDTPGFPHSATALPWDPSKLLVLGATPSRAAVLSLFVPAERRFLPSTRELSDGAGSRIVSDASGRVWVLLPWSGELVILERR